MMPKKKSSAVNEGLYGELKSGFFVIAGPCMLENYEMAKEIAGALKEITASLSLPFIFKASYDKANRTSVKSYRGPGMKKGLASLQKIKKSIKVPVLTDIHETKDAKPAAETADILQIPAFLCRQTDLVTAACKTGRIVNIKKGQFLSPYEIKSMVNKAEASGNRKLLLTERGFSFGYNNLVVDMKSIAMMKKTGYPAVIDATHAVQRPGGAGDSSAGEREFVPVIAKAAVAAGAAGVFLEVHNNVEYALSDRETQLTLQQAEKLLAELKKIYETVKE